MVTGAIASAIYGDPRMTRDVDVVVELSAADGKRLARLFPPEEFYLPPLEVIRVEAERVHGGHFNVIHHESGLKADIYPLGQDPLHLWAFPRRSAISLAGESVWFAPPEYVILRKLEFYLAGGSERHLRDIRGMLAVSGRIIDLGVIGAKAEEFGLEKAWATVRKELGTGQD
jgi:hypothetical protein